MRISLINTNRHKKCFKDFIIPINTKRVRKLKKNFWNFYNFKNLKNNGIFLEGGIYCLGCVSLYLFVCNSFLLLFFKGVLYGGIISVLN